MKKTKKLFSTVTIFVIAAMLLTGSAFAVTGEATVNSWMLNVREGAGTQYTIIDVAYQGNAITVLQDDGSGWVQVSFHGQTGYVNKLYLTFAQESTTQTYTAPAQTTAPAQAAPTQSVSVTAAAASTYGGGSGNGVIHGDGVYMRSGPSLSSSVLNTLYNGTTVQVNGACGAWYEIVYGGSVGYVYADYVVMNGQSVTYTMTVATTTADTPIYPEPATPEINAEPAQVQPVQQTVTTTVQSVPVTEQAPAQTVQQTASAGSASGQKIVDTAMQYIGVPYKWAGTSPETGFDCSGFVYYVYGENGYKLNRVAQSMTYNGTEVDLDNLQAGDVLLFGSSEYNIYHTGIYIGNGEFIHSPSSGYTVTTQKLSDTYGIRLITARRIVE